MNNLVFKTHEFIFVGGETIRAINQQTGAHCELDRRPPGNPNEKTFIIRGNPEQIDNAKKLICEKAGLVSIDLNFDSMFY